ncbi:transporter [Rufibacter immobilis]|uniref:Transporter n=1 Tax=Rufibacter immobilis TaxID=1348778 RepID=A0A3M9MPF5_9BACT|nr:transporter [Rufibacter immobilis]RNI27406.1 transporter [Rufibacter immobilis]
MKLRLLLLAALLPALSYAQSGPDNLKTSPPIDTDRPNQTESAKVVPVGTLQLESGLLRQTDLQDGERTTDFYYPAVLLRVGVWERLELRLKTDYHRQRLTSPQGSNEAKGLDAITVGTKIKVSEEKGLLPAIAFLGHLTLPSGSSVFRPATFAPDFRLSLSHSLSQRLELGYNMGYEWNGDNSHGSGIYTLSLGADLPHHFGAFVELYGDKPHHGHWRHAADGGFTFMPRHNMQLDLSAEVSLNHLAPDYFLSAGLSLRMPR